jgi:hypothetical protein
MFSDGDEIMDATMESSAAKVPHYIKSEDKSLVSNEFAPERANLIKVLKSKAHVVYIKCNETAQALTAVRRAILSYDYRLKEKKNASIKAFEWSSAFGVSEYRDVTFDAKAFPRNRWLDTDESKTIRSAEFLTKPSIVAKEGFDVDVLKAINSQSLSKNEMYNFYFVVPDLLALKSNPAYIDVLRKLEDMEVLNKNIFVTILILGSQEFSELPSDFLHTFYKLDWNRPKTNEEVKNFIYSLMSKSRLEDIDEICKVLAHKEYKTIENILCYAMVEQKLHQNADGKFTSGHIIKLIETGMF